jgi:cytochrome c oxidase subunit I+III
VGLLPAALSPCATDHRRVGERYLVTALGFFLLAGMDSLLLRAQLAVPEAALIGPRDFAQLFTMHGTGMMFLFAAPASTGLLVRLLPPLLGADDVAYPRLNALGYWLYLFGGLGLYASALPDVGNFLVPGSPLPDLVPDVGWTAEPPLTLPAHAPGPNVGFWLFGALSAAASGIAAAVVVGSTVAAARRRDGPLPVLAWSGLASALAALVAFPALLVAGGLLGLERAVGWVVFDPTRGGDPALWWDLLWIHERPELYLLFLPFAGVVSAVVEATCRRLVGRGAVLAAVASLPGLALLLWAQHGLGARAPWLGAGLAGAAAFLVAAPLALLVGAWVATLLVARPAGRPALLFAAAAAAALAMAALSSVALAVPTAADRVDGTYALVAHLHVVLLAGVVFPLLAALHEWWPLATGRRLSDRLGLVAFWLWSLGALVGFAPPLLLGLLGMPRRVYTYSPWQGLDELNAAAGLGAAAMALGTLVVLANAGLSLVVGGAAAGAEAGPAAPDSRLPLLTALPLSVALAGWSFGLLALAPLGLAAAAVLPVVWPRARAPAGPGAPTGWTAALVALALLVATGALLYCTRRLAA